MEEKFLKGKGKGLDMYKEIDKRTDDLSYLVIKAAIEVHKELGPGLLESIYEACMVRELISMGIKVEQQVGLDIIYKKRKLDTKLRLDLLVENEIIIELKSVDKILPIHESQIITYLKLSHKRLGLLINFNVPLLKKGIHRIVL